MVLTFHDFSHPLVCTDSEPRFNGIIDYPETFKCVHLMSGSLWSLISLRVTSQACLKRPSVPIGPMAWTMFWVRRKGTTSGTSNVSP